MNPILLNIPDRLSTARLSLRVPQAGDGAVTFSGVRESLAELKPWLPWAKDDYSLENAEEWCRKAAASFITRDTLHFLIFLADGSQYLGNISAFAFDWKLGKFEIGYWLRTSQNGHGFMTEAAGALILLVKQAMRVRRIEILADAQNQKSRRVAERLGFQCEGTLRAAFLKSDGSPGDRCIYALVEPAGQESSS